ncbi:MAG TPA: hypothetical protein VH592_05420 [Gemmataceae bacterium]
MFRLRFLAPLFVAGAVGSGFLIGDDRTGSAVGRTTVPKPYSQLNLTPKQKNEIFRIRAKYTADIIELEEKIKDLKRQEKKEFEKLLTATQKARLQEIRGGKDSDDEDDRPTTPDKKKTTLKDKK